MKKVVQYVNKVIEKFYARKKILPFVVNPPLFKSRLDKFWMHQEVKYDYTSELIGTGDRSEYLHESDWLHSYILVYIDQYGHRYTLMPASVINIDWLIYPIDWYILVDSVTAGAERTHHQSTTHRWLSALQDCFTLLLFTFVSNLL